MYCDGGRERLTGQVTHSDETAHPLAEVGPTSQSIEYERRKEIRGLLLGQQSAKRRHVCPHRIFANVWRYFGLLKLGAGDCYRHLAGRGLGAAQPPGRHRAAPTAKNDPSQNVHITELKAPL